MHITHHCFQAHVHIMIANHLCMAMLQAQQHLMCPSLGKCSERMTNFVPAQCCKLISTMCRPDAAVLQALHALPAPVACLSLQTFLRLVSSSGIDPKRNASNFLLSVLQSTAGSEMHQAHNFGHPVSWRHARSVGVQILRKLQVRAHCDAAQVARCNLWHTCGHVSASASARGGTLLRS